MAKCKKCDSLIPKSIIVDEKKRNLQSRKYCLDCSPFGEHNTRKIDQILPNGKLAKICPSCERNHSQKGTVCFACYFLVRKRKVSQKISNIVGDSCWLCGYNKTKRSLCFHHVYPEHKKFQLTTRELMLKWSRVSLELQKCIFVCSNCHGEIHSGLIEFSLIEQLWIEFWASRLTANRDSYKIETEGSTPS